MMVWVGEQLERALSQRHVRALIGSDDERVTGIQPLKSSTDGRIGREMTHAVEAVGNEDEKKRSHVV